jgi:hypothetical protein
MEGEVAYTLLYYPLNIDKLVDLGVGDPRWTGVTPLIGAIMSNQPSIVQYLVDQGADVNVKTPLGWTPLTRRRGCVLLQRQKGISGCCGNHQEGDGQAVVSGFSRTLEASDVVETRRLSR